MLDIAAPPGHALANQIGSNAAFFATDVSPQESVGVAVTAIFERFGYLNVPVRVCRAG